VSFSNGDRLTTDATGRALFVARLNPGVIYGSIAGRRGESPPPFSRPAKRHPLRPKSHPRQFRSLNRPFELFGEEFLRRCRRQ